MATLSSNGKEIKIGSVVGFKCDIEQYGEVVRIDGRWLTLVCSSGFSGEYIGGETETKELAEDCWID